MKEYCFEIRPNGNDLKVILRGESQAAAGNGFNRNLPNLDPRSMDSFRMGKLDPLAMARLSDDVSRWLFDPDLRPTVQNWLRANSDLRLVFSVDEDLQSRLAEVPIELLQTDSVQHLAVHNRVKSLVHLLPKVGTPPDATTGQDWPFRVLIVRSNPTDVNNGKVPPADQFRQKILTVAGTRLGPGYVEVDLLSSEAGAVTLGPPTFQQFRDTLETLEYDVLVFLGHGDIEQIHPDLPPLSLLHFETEGHLHDSINSRQLAALLQRHPVPVVLLAGCLTAAGPGDPEVEQLPVWMRGNQGMAQALVNSESGVAFAVGMRCQVDVNDTLAFVERFFVSLLLRHKGNVEMAVSEARASLYLLKPLTSAWAAPMAFTSLRPEPLLEYMTKDPVCEQSIAMRMELKTRATLIWPLLTEQKPASRSPALTNVVRANRDSLAAAVLQTCAMLLPELVDAAQPGSTVTMPVTFGGALTLKHFEGRINLGAGLAPVGIKAAKPLLDAGFKIWFNPNDSTSFFIWSKAGPAQLPAGTIFEIEIAVQPEARGTCVVDLLAVDTDARLPYWAGSNAVIVLPA